jgi:hypothetical protein
MFQGLKKNPKFESRRPDEGFHDLFCDISTEMRHEKKFEGCPRPAYTVLHLDLLYCSEQFAWGTDPWLMPMALQGVPPVEMWN